MLERNLLFKYAHYDAVAGFERLGLFETRVSFRVQLNAIARGTKFSENHTGGHWPTLREVI